MHQFNCLQINVRLGATWCSLYTVKLDYSGICNSGCTMIVLIAAQYSYRHTARYCYDRPARLSVCPSVRHTLVLYS